MKFRPFSTTLFALLAASPMLTAQVFISEAFNNPPGSLDNTKEFIELQGTPGMKLDGYAVCLIYGRMEKLIGTGQMPPQLADEPEIDEFFSLDGLSLGRNGLLVIGIGFASDYPLLPDTNFAHWLTLWNGPLDVPNKLNNDGSSTMLLVRNRPGETQANPFDPAGPLWVKDGSIDREIFFGVLDPDDGIIKDQIGDGIFDIGGVNVIGTPMYDYTGRTTPTSLDDLEIVDEVSWEHDRGWEYDVDERRSDIGSTLSGIGERRVHTLDDPQGINPDVISRVDYRTKGVGHPPTAGATGQLPNGNNWQDTATEQWIRGESVQTMLGGIGSPPYFYYDSGPNLDPAPLQPYLTNVPRWLADGSGSEYSFTTNSYQILAGHVNALSVPFIPGDVDRDGDCDGDDVAKIVAVFADENWLFINSWSGSPEGTTTDPATQTRPWDVDGSGDNGIDPIDLQWALNFQGDTTGRVKGVVYDNTGPSTTGVVLQSGLSTTVTITAIATADCAPSLSQLRTNDIVELEVFGQVTAGANSTPGAENGVMQFTHDLQFTVPGLLELVDVEALGAFSITDPSHIEKPFDGTFGANRINGYTTSFTQGLSGAAPLYRVRLRAVASGSTSIVLFQSAGSPFSLSNPTGVKIGHTASNGDPGAVVYPNFVPIGVTGSIGGFVGEYGVGCPGTGGFTPRLSGNGCATPGGSLSLEFSNGLPGAAPIMFLGLGNLTGALNPNCSLQILPLLPTAISLFPLIGSGPGNGEFTIPGLVIPPTVPLGVSVYLQALFADPAGFGGASATNPLRITFGS